MYFDLDYVVGANVHCSF